MTAISELDRTTTSNSEMRSTRRAQIWKCLQLVYFVIFFGRRNREIGNCREAYLRPSPHFVRLQTSLGKLRNLKVKYVHEKTLETSHRRPYIIGYLDFLCFFCAIRAHCRINLTF